jgi:hypothetical protein
MDGLSDEKVQLLSKHNGWSLSEAQGYIEGEACRQRGAAPSAYGGIGMDGYGRGFRAGYYERHTIERPKPLLMASVPTVPAAGPVAQRPTNLLNTLAFRAIGG